MKKSSIMWIFFTIVILTIIGAWIGWGLFSPEIFRNIVGEDDLTHVGQWGDSFGAFNALISTLGFSAVLATLIIQSRSVSDQARDLHRQRFESSFFELLKLMRELRDEVEFSFSRDYNQSTARNELDSESLLNFKYTLEDSDRDRLVGHRGIVAAVQEIRHWIGNKSVPPSPEMRKFLIHIYLRRVHRRSESSLGPYFRIIYTILMRLREDFVLSNLEKIQYGNLLRSQLTSHEITLLAINGLAPISKDLSSLLVDFRMLKYMPEGKMRGVLEGVYPKEAFLPR